MSNTHQWRMPAEWESHEATWISWPNLRGHGYPDTLEQVRPAFLEMVKAIALSEEAWINVSGADEEAWIRDHLDQKTLEKTRFFAIPTNEPWCRDHGPSILVNDDRTKRAGVIWRFNSWGGKYPPFDLDAAAGMAMTHAIGAEVIESRVVFEGGALEVNGIGDVLTSPGCLLDVDRNPWLTKTEAEEILRRRLGADRVHWLPDIEVLGDDTDGHVDVTTRFTDVDRLLISMPDRSLPEYQGLVDRLARLREHFSVDTLPMLPAGYSETYEVPTPRGYANFHLTNGAVLMPAYSEPEDDVAAQILGRHFPSRTVIPIDCRYVVEGQGVIHCLTQQVPAIDSL